jgi:endonuclease/exonuclease/phosphatase family metal-dependent hydrolase
MRVMTWNVLWRFAGNWRRRAPGILDTLKVYRPDVLGLVETWGDNGTSQPAQLAAALGMHGVFAPTSLPPAPRPIESPDQRGIEVGIGLVSRWPILATEIHELPHDQRGGKAPTALLATLDHPRAALHVIVSCTEWEPEYAGDHLAQCGALAELAMDPRLDGRLPVLLVGDLNADPSQPELGPLLKSMVDTWTAGGGAPDAVTLDSAVPFAPVKATKQIDRRIDHVLARAGRPGRPVTVRGAFLAGDRPIGGVYPSDHYAVGADLEP